MTMWRDIKNEQKTMYRKAGIKTLPILKKAHFFRQFEKQYYPANDYWNNRGERSKFQAVTFITPFQSATEDVLNDIKAVLIKPITCFLLSWFHIFNMIYEIWLILVNLITCDGAETLKHGRACLTSGLSIFVYSIYACTELLSTILSLMSRTLMTIANLAYTGSKEQEDDADDEDDEDDEDETNECEF